MKNIKRALSLLIATMLALALPAETLAEGLYIEYDAAPSQVESAVIETEESGQADIVQDEALAQAISDGETGENQTLSAAAIDADVPEAEELSLGDDEESSALDEIIPEPSGLMPPSYVEDAESVEAVVIYRFIVGDEVVVTQAAKDGEEIVAPDDPTAPEGMVFAGWVLEDGTAVFEDDETVIAHTDPIVSEINVFAKFVAATADPASSDEDMSLEDEAVTGDAETVAGDESVTGDDNVAAVEDQKSEPDAADETEPSVENDAGVDGNVFPDGNADADGYADSVNDADAVNSADEKKDADNHTDNEEDNTEVVENKPFDDEAEGESAEDASTEGASAEDASTEGASTESAAAEGASTDTMDSDGKSGEADEGSDQDNTIKPIQVVFNVTPDDAVVTVKAVNSETEEEAADTQSAEGKPDETNENTTAPITAQDDGSFALVPGAYTYTVSAEGYKTVSDVLFTVTEEALTIDVVLEVEEESSDNTECFGTIER